MDDPEGEFVFDCQRNLERSQFWPALTPALSRGERENRPPLWIVVQAADQGETSPR